MPTNIEILRTCILTHLDTQIHTSHVRIYYVHVYVHVYTRMGVSLHHVIHLYTQVCVCSIYVCVYF